MILLNYILITPYFLIILISAVSICITGLIVYKKNKSRPVNRYFLLVCISTVIWMLSSTFADVITDTNTILFFTKFAIVGGFFIPTTFLFLSFYFPEKNVTIKKKYLLFILAPLFLGLVLAPTKYNIQTVEIEEWGTKFTPGPLYYYLLFYFIVYIGTSVYIFIKNYHRYNILDKLRLRYFLIGSIITIIGGLATNLLLPLLFDWSKASVYGPIFSLFFIFTLAYCIIRYRLFDIRVAIRSGFLKLILAAFAYGTFYGITWLFVKTWGSVWATSALIAGVFIAIAFALLWPQIEKLAIKFSNRFLYASIYTVQDTLSKLAQDLTSIIDLKQITALISKVIFKVLDVERVGILVKLPNQTKFHPYQMIGFASQDDGSNHQKEDHLTKHTSKKHAIKKEFFLADNHIVNDYLLKHQYPVVKNELTLKCQDCKDQNEQTQMREICEIMNDDEIELILPLIIKDQLIGLIALGQKQSNDAYTKEDVKLLETLSNQATIAVENARLYDNMEEMVEERTNEIKQKNIKLQKLLKMRSEFLDIASHQLRTPISIIKGSASVLSEGDFDDSSEKERKEVYKAILIKTEKLTQIVTDMLYASELDTSKFNLSGKLLQTIELIPYLENIIKSHQDLAKEKNIQLELNKTADSDIKARISEHYFEVVMDNLIINALTYTKQNGKVEVNIKLKQDTIRIEVKDNGIGIPKQDQKELFTKFKRAKNANSMHTDGSGLGLFIVKKMIKAHPKGACGFESEEGKGSAFWVEVERAGG